MPNVSAYPNSGALALAGTIQTLYAASVIHLCKTPPPTDATTTLADLLAIEADYDGYAPITVATYTAPYLDPAGGATTTSGQKIFYYASPSSPPVTNNIWGFFIESAGGVLFAITSFAIPAPMAQVGDAVPVNVLLNFGG